MKAVLAPSQKAQKLLYYSVIALCLATPLLLVLYLVSSQFAALWYYYMRVYIMLLLASSWYVLILVFYDEYRERRWPTLPDDMLISVIVPSYNEDLHLLAEALIAIDQTRGRKEIIVIDDGSINNSRELIEFLGRTSLARVHRLAANQGKREALTYAVRHLVSPDSFCVVTIDSDTILHPEALRAIAAPLAADPRIGATTGDVQLRNERQNWLTRMVGTYYWMGLNLYKRGQSSIGNVVCCSGCLSAYRTPLLREVIDEFIDQTFLGERCTHSEDRHLTNLILRRGYRVHYVPEAISYTETPSTIRAFCRQQLRWKRGYVRESIYTIAYAWKNQKRLFFQLLFWDLSAPYFTLGLRLAMIMLLVISPVFFLTVVLPLWVVATLLRYLLVALKSPKKLPGLFLYALFFELVLYWVNIYALFTVRNKRWVTRGV